MKPNVLRYLILAVICCSLTKVAIAQESAAPGHDKPGASVATPRTTDGHPDLSGLWNGGNAQAAGGAGGAVDRDAYGAVGFDPNLLAARHTEGRTGADALINFERDSTLVKRMDGNLPQYKPQYWETVKNLDRNNNDTDPSYACMPAGVPRLGPPTQVVQTERSLFLMYVPGGASGATATFREVPMDGRKHTPIEDLDGTWNGESIGHWDGDTAVIDSIGFNTATWLDKEGYFHSENMHVIERLSRNGNTLTWQSTVDDPDVLMRPWQMAPVSVRLNPNPNAVLPEPAPCSERDIPHTVTKEHH
jgi:hypothetical protein